MIKCLVDAGPLIALFDRDDTYHTAVKTFLQEYRGMLYSSWPVITEVSHMLDFHVETQIDFLQWIRRGAVTLLDIDTVAVDRIIELSQKYADVPMDLADSSLVALSEAHSITDIMTIDSDYYIYRTKKGKALKNLLEKAIRPQKRKK